MQEPGTYGVGALGVGALIEGSGMVRAPAGELVRTSKRV